jgi:hypothetical protein
MNTRNGWVGTVFAAMALSMTSCGDHTKPIAAPVQSMKPLDLPQIHPLPPIGSPAIPPRSSGTPAFTLDDVKQFVMAHPLQRGSNGGKIFAITRAEFMSSKQVVELLHGESTGFPDDHMLCYVEMHGPVTFSGPPGVTLSYEGAIEVFDAQTGNFLIVGGLREPSIKK